MAKQIFYIAFISSFLIHIFMFTIINIKPLEEYSIFEKRTKISFIDIQDLIKHVRGHTPVIGNTELEKKSILENFFNAKFNDTDEDTLIYKEAQKLKQDVLYDISAEITSKRKLLRLYKPNYPIWAKKIGLEAEVQLKFKISKQGVVQDILIEKMSGFPELDVLGFRAIRKWHFEPIMKQDGVDEWAFVTLKFEIS